MMKRSILFLTALSIILVANSCTDDFTELNTDPKNLTVDNLSQSEFGGIVKAAQYTPAFLGDPARGPFQLTQSLFSDIYGGYFATTAPNFDSDKFILVGGWLNGAFNYFYASAAPQIKFAEDFAADNDLPLENAMMKVWRVWSYHRVTDYWGPIPYSEFGNGELSVAYDSQEDIYRDFFATLDEAISVLQSNEGATSFLAGNDLVYGGDADQWLKFANTLRLRLAMRVKYVDPTLSQTEAEKAAVLGQFIEENGDNAIIETNPDFRNPYNTITQWGEFRMSADMESILKGYEDPRMQFYAAPAAEPDPTDDPAGVEFPFEGMRNGQSKVDKQGTNFNAVASDMAPAYTVAGAPGPEYVAMNAAESFFLRAEGALEGWNMGGGTAQDFYEQGIVASHVEYGLNGNNLSGNSYVESTNTPASYNGTDPAPSQVPVAFNTGGSTEEQLEQIITQKWISLYPNSQEAWAEKRRTGYPTFYNRLNTDNSTIPVNTVPRRVTYVDGEFTTNGAAVEEAISGKLGGPDNGTTRLWWDAR
ncbi:SusD/RagB family nutrient-binding outer membrane lipoprotein [Tunicatimonas pelagia]|uniref:SusD/RagB family nutrient-binding outer membrane lipoprotein n=1 Tax=Tunicatimonas pelagia TaxID=931531 RepID=UPI0026658669|nr:SusD/RagB family nutrient-binding outer membrane lipoprotein [Tunicatimonas pelagia]WKN41879.1 SusD/RagB family nutrient-binding outer membrane lipoprotein [Tunicatimonas pelagia]